MAANAHLYSGALVCLVAATDALAERHTFQFGPTNGNDASAVVIDGDRDLTPKQQHEDACRSDQLLLLRWPLTARAPEAIVSGVSGCPPATWHGESTPARSISSLSLGQ